MRPDLKTQRALCIARRGTVAAVVGCLAVTPAPAAQPRSAGDNAGLRKRVIVPEGILLVYDAAPPGEAWQLESGYLAWWHDFAGGSLYVYDVRLTTSTDVAAAEAALGTDRAVGPFAEATAVPPRPPVSDGIGFESPVADIIHWRPATWALVRELMGVAADAAPEDAGATGPEVLQDNIRCRLVVYARPEAELPPVYPPPPRATPEDVFDAVLTLILCENDDGCQSPPCDDIPPCRPHPLTGRVPRCCDNNPACCGDPDPCCGDPDPCCGSIFPCCGNPDPCCGNRCCYDPGCCESPDPCCNSSDPCCGDSNRCCQTDNPCCESPDPCCNPSDPCCGNPDPCCNPDNPCCGQGTPCCGAPDPCCNNPDPCCGCSGVCCSDRCCVAGSSCCGSGCCPSGRVCCNGTCCGAGEVCCGGDTCCEPDSCCGDACCDAPVRSQACEVRVTLKEITFYDDHTVYAEGPPCEAADPGSCWGTATILAGPDWKSSGNPDHPVAYTRGTPTRITVRLEVTGSTGGGLATLRVAGPGGIGGDGTFNVPCGTEERWVTVVTTPLPSVVKAYTPAGLAWSVQAPGESNWTFIRNTQHPIYVTFGDPPADHALDETHRATERRLNFVCYAAAQAGDALAAADGIHFRLDNDPPLDGLADPNEPTREERQADDWKLLAGHTPDNIWYFGECHDQVHLMNLALQLVGIPDAAEYKTFASTDAVVDSVEVTSAGALGYTQDLNGDGIVGNEAFKLIWDFDPPPAAERNWNNFEGSIYVAGKYYAVWNSYDANSTCRLYLEIVNGEAASQHWILPLPDGTLYVHPGSVMGPISCP
ncbi:MAG: hypothetical protein HY763_09965 [Planctomycetes bacterium]|nr:hypothetical protein [Planctomycetota bacterium]